MNPIVIREVAETSLADFVREEIAGGCTALSQIVSRRMEISRGSFFLITPQALVPAKVENWNWSISGLEWKVADSVLAHVLGGYLRGTENRVLIQDYMARSSDSSFKDIPFWRFTVRNCFGSSRAQI